ncbi:MAG TPA: DUF4157 domain-containing protein [Pyrinomonadaceae bacterium]|jgi:outer membrane protein OmpA-like peptidoglycan-associated protein|nr:DUF4157 domain-containing protein [Pyrinomonadaceae bacterium]
MFAVHSANQAGKSAEAQPKRAEPALNKKTASQINPIWQTLVLNSASLQPKLAISQPNDPSEQEADRIADRVMRMTLPRPNGSELSISADASLQAQRACGQCKEEEEKLKRKEQGDRASLAFAPTIVHETLTSAGQPLDHVTRAFMEPRLGYDLGQVRIHTDSRAADSARAVNALAYTVGRDVVFAPNQYAPTTARGRTLLAHELAHTVQQGGSTSVLHRQVACPSRPASETAQSRTSVGVLPDNVAAGTNRIDVQDFAVGSAALPPGVTNHTEWQRAMSILVGDPSMIAQLLGFTDCVGTQGENLSLRRTRIDTVLAAMPPAARSRVVINFVLDATSFLDTNTTPEGRARNRAVRLQWMSSPPRDRQACDLINRAAANLDEYIFLVSCVESRLGLTAPTDARTALSVVRQIYYGTGSWSASRNAIWGDVIDVAPWSPGTDPTPRLGATLMSALRASQVVEGIDVGHLFTGLDAMLRPHDVSISGLPSVINATTVPNEEWATWAGDVGSAAAEWVVDTTFTAPSTPLSQATYFTRFAGDDDLRGNIDSFAMRAGFNPGGTPSSRLAQTLRLTGTLSESLRQYYRLTSSALGLNRSRSSREFVEAYGGVLSGTTITNRPALAARLRSSVRQFASLYMLDRLFRRGYFSSAPRPPGAPEASALFDPAVDAMIDRFISWLETHL